jgi:nucleoside 2-deoxyribosyltransferase
MKIYFAGPLFTPYERTYIDQCAKRMRDAGMEVFVPHEIALPDPVTQTWIYVVVLDC